MLVTNYDRCRFDEAAITALTRGKRVLFICDEVQKILTDAARTQTRRAVDRDHRRVRADDLGDERLGGEVQPAALA